MNCLKYEGKQDQILWHTRTKKSLIEVKYNAKATSSIRSKFEVEIVINRYVLII